jgi:hypothetical protein
MTSRRRETGVRMYWLATTRPTDLGMQLAGVG